MTDHDIREAYLQVYYSLELDKITIGCGCSKCVSRISLAIATLSQALGCTLACTEAINSSRVEQIRAQVHEGIDEGKAKVGARLEKLRADPGIN